jgi:hypothetical protein
MASVRSVMACRYVFVRLAVSALLIRLGTAASSSNLMHVIGDGPVSLDRRADWYGYLGW